jgi:hypothetical protein
VPLPSFGRGTKASRNQPAEAPDDPNAPGHQLESYLSALSPDDAETTMTGRGFGGSEVHSLRLSIVANEQLRDLAEQHGTSPQALAQEWILQRLAWETNREHR